MLKALIFCIVLIALAAGGPARPAKTRAGRFRGLGRARKNFKEAILNTRRKIFNWRTLENPQLDLTQDVNCSECIFGMCRSDPALQERELDTIYPGTFMRIEDIHERSLITYGYPLPLVFSDTIGQEGIITSATVGNYSKNSSATSLPPVVFLSDAIASSGLCDNINNIATPDGDLCCPTNLYSYIPDTLVDIDNVTHKIPHLVSEEKYQVLQIGCCGTAGSCTGVCKVQNTLHTLFVWTNTTEGVVPDFKTFLTPGYCSCRSITR
ncbi:uncharacterized protein LOC106173012 isoform X2 [Lingula anatina]|nr:uncharacterized protein LOC106173012 isoform X2 [Lingula anatina]|eukprot:XP_023930255.1 uncharacterized protein LOC106173012 isoform X2 [Lingula anatina]